LVSVVDEPNSGQTPAERAVLDAAQRWYDDHEPWPTIAPDEPEYDLKTAVEVLRRILEEE
jgi:hypothetical protein